ncbi:hypothetical protein BDN72DRAFT_880398 [Pluteus cervinus]|uniref:Uncharacterized protein n=1 Tax=Pluteus cervinus TaxID=181527 RepID=A0ACD3AK63_9AGAR|nr:hypothetical protein BDN72DRAFT_880398 [Pluteus cervinus]
MMRFAVFLTSILTVAMALPSTKDTTPAVEFILTESKGEIPLTTNSSIESRQVPWQNTTISFFPGPDCHASGGMRLLIEGHQYGVCLAPMPPQYRSFVVDKPSAIWLPYLIYVGSCASLIAVPRTNTCYNLNKPGTGWERGPTGGGTF